MTPRGGEAADDAGTLYRVRVLLTALIFAGLAAAVHLYIFVLESITWTTDRTRAVFGTTAEEAEVTKPLAFNQGFYNLFLAVVTLVGVGLVGAAQPVPGLALIVAGVGSMLAAAVVLIAFSPDKARAAMVQGAFPALSLVLLLVAQLLGQL